MNKYLLNKVIVIISLVCLLLLAVKVVNNLVSDRESYQQKVIRDISQSSSGAQTIMGPILVVPYDSAQTVADPQTGRNTMKTKQLEHCILPQTLHVDGSTNVEPRRLGIYQAQVYSAELNFSGSFSDFSILNKIKNQGDFIRFGTPYILFSVADSKGIISSSAFEFDGKAFTSKDNIKNTNFENGIFIPVDLGNTLDTEGEKAFSFKLNVQGTQNLSVIPLGKDSTMALTSNWRHPNFMGAMLPKNHAINKSGFTANWQSTWSANQIQDKVLSGQISAARMSSLPAFSVNMVQAVTDYQRIERTLKYAILFISLTFICFISFEALAQLRIHPVQYTLVGVALVMFYMLLLVLSEHLGFDKAYSIAAICNCSLIALYLNSVLKSILRGTCFAAGLAGLYGTLFMILRSEDMALLFGSGLLFTVLAIIMLLTRKVDWYQVTDAISQKKCKTVKPTTQPLYPNVPS